MSRRVLAAAGLFLALAAGSVVAKADGVLFGPGQLPEAARTSIAARIAQAKHDTPEAFARIRSLKGHRPEVYGKTRSLKPSVADELAAIGPGGSWAIVDAIAYSPLPRGAANDEEWTSVQLGLVGRLSDLRVQEASAVLERVLAMPGVQDDVRRAAGAGLGKLGGEREIAVLVAALAQRDARREAGLFGLRRVRRPDAVAAVAALLRQGDTEEATARVAATTLGHQGSSWAWATGNAGREEERSEVQARCVEALVVSYLRYQGEGREYAARALQMVEQPATLERIAAEQSARGAKEDQELLAQLARRLQAAWGRR